MHLNIGVIFLKSSIVKSNFPRLFFIIISFTQSFMFVHFPCKKENNKHVKKDSTIRWYGDVCFLPRNTNLIRNDMVSMRLSYVMNIKLLL